MQLQGCSTSGIESDTTFHLLKRKQSKNFVFDLMDNNGMKVNLPLGYGKVSAYGKDMMLENILYLTEFNRKALVNFHGVEFELNDENVFSYLLGDRVVVEKFDNEQYDRRAYPITLVADRDVKFKYVQDLKSKLNLCFYDKVIYLLDTEIYDQATFISNRFLPWSEKRELRYNALNLKMPRVVRKKRGYYPPLPRPSLDQLSGNSILVEFSKGRSFIDLDKVKQERLVERLKERLKLNPKDAITYYASGDADYQDYINILSSIHRAIDEHRKENGKYFVLLYEVETTEELNEIKKAFQRRIKRE